MKMSSQKLRRSLFAAFAIFCVALIAGCSGSGDGETTPRATADPDQKIVAITTTGMIADIVKNVGGERVTTQSLMGAGVDPHLYKATPGDIRKLGDADMVFYNGLHLEGKMADVLASLANKKPSIPVAEDIPNEELLEFETAPEFPDPHVWFDVKMWMLAADKARDALIEFDPESKELYTSNAVAYKKDLKELDEYVTENIAKIPSERRVLVTAHDAFGYFGRAYGIEVEGLQGISTATEASLLDVQRIVNLLVKRQIKAVFVESSVPRRTIEAVVAGAKAKGHDVVIGGELFADAMGESGTTEGTYVGMVRFNVDTIVNALK